MWRSGNLIQATLQFPASHQNLITVDSQRKIADVAGKFSAKNSNKTKIIQLFSWERKLLMFVIKVSLPLHVPVDSCFCKLFECFTYSEKTFLQICFFAGVKSCYATFSLHKSDVKAEKSAFPTERNPKETIAWKLRKNKSFCISFI